MDCRVIASVLICLAFMSIATEGLELRCRCIERHSAFIHPRRILNLEIIPAGAHCERVEVIIMVKGGKQENQKVCVDHQAKWVQKLINLTIKKK
ncbi:hypothetical protein COCON_G00114670 [Conger conger]|uniref:Chemokine interleukin-8-like domain-containing protein n=1 Tax=Conger conger TaxID=82655 RepID=A0A9Q1DGD7_CONCO|nr:C-X-C motif chemokine 19 [Conger conger]KAJ8268860.1 hypothetical protein COCON_G00114670 [Conger conger]